MDTAAKSTQRDFPEFGDYASLWQLLVEDLDETQDANAA
jgi:hypothetical protein